MAEPTRDYARPADAVTGDSLDRMGPTALISYLNICIFVLTAVGVFALIVSGKEISAVWAGIVGGILGSTGGGLATTNQFWLGGNVGAKSATSALKQLATQPSVSAPAGGAQTINVGGQPGEDFAIPPPPEPAP